MTTPNKTRHAIHIDIHHGKRHIQAKEVAAV